MTIYSKDKALKNKVWLKTQGRCYLCGCELLPFGNVEDNSFHVDHKFPISKGGTSDIENLFPACLKCNHIKGNRTYDEFMSWIEDEHKYISGAVVNSTCRKKLDIYIYNFDGAIKHILDVRIGHYQSKIKWRDHRAWKEKQKGQYYAWT